MHNNSLYPNVTQQKYMVIDEEANVVNCSEALAKYLGKTKADIIGNGSSNLVAMLNTDFSRSKYLNNKTQYEIVFSYKGDAFLHAFSQVDNNTTKQFQSNFIEIVSSEDNNALSELTSREILICKLLVARFTQEEVAALLNLSRARITQIIYKINTQLNIEKSSSSKALISYVKHHTSLRKNIGIDFFNLLLAQPE